MTDMAKTFPFSQLIEDLSQKGYSVIDQLFSAADLQEICFDFADFEKEVNPARVSESKKLIPQIRGDQIRWLEPKENKLKPYFRFLEETLPLLNKEFFLSLKSYETHLSLYPPGTFYQRHWDQTQGRTERKVTFVFYLNEEWKSGDGGELLLCGSERPHPLIETITPTLNKMLFFRSELFPHEVKTTHKTRRSLTGWMRDDTLPSCF